MIAHMSSVEGFDLLPLRLSRVSSTALFAQFVSVARTAKHSDCVAERVGYFRALNFSAAEFMQ
jgi:hypothetical protein